MSKKDRLNDVSLTERIKNLLNYNEIALVEGDELLEMSEEKLNDKVLEEDFDISSGGGGNNGNTVDFECNLAIPNGFKVDPNILTGVNIDPTKVDVLGCPGDCIESKPAAPINVTCRNGGRTFNLQVPSFDIFGCIPYIVNVPVVCFDDNSRCPDTIEICCFDCVCLNGLNVVCDPCTSGTPTFNVEFTINNAKLEGPGGTAKEKRFIKVEGTVTVTCS